MVGHMHYVRENWICFESLLSRKQVSFYEVAEIIHDWPFTTLFLYNEEAHKDSLELWQ